MTLEEITDHLESLSDPERARQAARYFKAVPGGYGEGDRFFGIAVPTIRKMVKKFPDISIDTLQSLLQSAFHEARLFALLALVSRFEKGDDVVREKIFRLYLDNTKSIDNWDLVDSSAPHILGCHLKECDRGILYKLAQSDSIWERRMAVLATFCYIRDGDFDDAFSIAGSLLADPEDLIHKAAGWMLREIGKRDHLAEASFLDRHYREMPRTMLRYAIEKFEPGLRKAFLSGTA